jgi:hypothetical protein
MSGEKEPQSGERATRFAPDPSLRMYKGGRITLDLSPEAYRVLQQLMNETSEGPDDLFRKALAMYKAAVEARHEGKAVGVANSPDALETEFVGF